jgi:hypothetical protein
MGIIAAGIVGGLAIGGSAIMGHQANQAMKGRMGAAMGALRKEYDELSAEQESRFAGLLGRFTSSYDSSVTGYETAGDALITDIDSFYDEILTGMAGRQEEALATYDVGRQNTIAASRRATEASMARQVGQNAFGGLGNTTFGNAAVSGIRAQGALQEGVIEEQYAAGKAGMMNRQALSFAGMQGQKANLMAGMGQAYNARLAAMQQQGATQAANLEAGGLNQWLSLQERPITLQYENSMQLAQVPSGMAAGAAAVGGIGSALLSGAAGGMMG